MQNPQTGHMEPIAPAAAAEAQAQGACVLTIGEMMEIRGGRFRVTHIGRRFVRLEGLPGTRVEEEFPTTGPSGPSTRWMAEARQLAAQCWCDRETSSLVMDTRIAEAVARRIAAWMETAAQFARDAEFYRDLIDRCARALGPEAFTSDDGSVQQDPVRLKVPELVERLATGRS